MNRYTIVVHPEDMWGNYHASIPALPGCFTQGATIGETFRRAEEAIRVHIKALAESGSAIPAAPVYGGRNAMVSL